MRHISLLCVGKLKEAYWRDACAEYGKRLSAFCRLTVTEVEEERLPENPSAAQIARAVQEEGRRLLAKVPAGAAVIAWCIEGKELDSPAFSETLDKLAVDGVNAAALVIGGSWGLSDDVKKAARLPFSHVAHDLPAPAGPGNGTRAALSGHADFPRREIS